MLEKDITLELQCLELVLFFTLASAKSNYSRPSAVGKEKLRNLSSSPSIVSIYLWLAGENMEEINIGNKKKKGGKFWNRGSVLSH